MTTQTKPTFTEPDTWEFEPAEPDVGIFQRTVYHCDGADDEPGDVTEYTFVRSTPSLAAKGLVEVVHEYTCLACNSYTVLTDQEPSDDFQ